MSRLREWFKKKNQQWKYEKIMRHIKDNNNCPNCGRGDPDVTKIYNNIPVDDDSMIWIAAMTCARHGCNTYWTAPQALNRLL